MKPITWLRKFAERGFRGYPLATLAFYGPDDRKASKIVLGMIDSRGAEPHLHKWIRETDDKDLRYDVGLQRVWIEIRGLSFVEIELDVDEINRFCAEEGIPNDGHARARLAARKARKESRQ